MIKSLRFAATLRRRFKKPSVKALSKYCNVFSGVLQYIYSKRIQRLSTFDKPMTGLEHFQRLKQAVLSEYRKHFPYFTGSWKSFSSQDIQNLIALIEENMRETVSEKWIYTHLKPAENEKLPRKDMLDILSRFCGYSGWDEFSFEEKAQGSGHKVQGRKRNLRKVFILGIAAAGIAVLLFLGLRKENRPTHKIKVTDQYTGKPVDADDVAVFEKDSVGEKPVPISNGVVILPTQKPAQVVVKSPYYAPKTVTINPAKDSTIVTVTPDDHAMMLKAFMKSDIKDWQTRKIQLDKILSDDLEVIVQLKDNLGAEAFNKKEFSQKLIIPTPSVRQLRIIEIKHGTDHKIQFIRMAQE